MVGEVSARRVEELRTDQPRIATGLCQLLLDCPLVTAVEELAPVEGMLIDLVNSGLQPTPGGGVPGWQRLNTSRVSTNQPDFLQGYQLARLVREKVGLGDDPIDSLPHLLRELDIQCDKSINSSLFRAAGCAAPGRRAHLVPSASEGRMQSYTASRFAIASAFGRLLWQARVPGQDLLCGAPRRPRDAQPKPQSQCICRGIPASCSRDRSGILRTSRLLSGGTIRDFQ